MCTHVNSLKFTILPNSFQILERETKKTEGSETNTKRLVERQEESQNSREHKVKTNRMEDGSEKNQTLHKSIDGSKRNVGGNLSIEPLKFIEVSWSLSCYFYLINLFLLRWGKLVVPMAEKRTKTKNMVIPLRKLTYDRIPTPQLIAMQTNFKNLSKLVKLIPLVPSLAKLTKIWIRAARTFK